MASQKSSAANCMNSQHNKQVILTTLSLHASRMALKSTKLSEKGRQFNVQLLKKS